MNLTLMLRNYASFNGATYWTVKRLRLTALKNRFVAYRYDGKECLLNQKCYMLVQNITSVHFVVLKDWFTDSDDPFILTIGDYFRYKKRLYKSLEKELWGEGNKSVF